MSNKVTSEPPKQPPIRLPDEIEHIFGNQGLVAWDMVRTHFKWVSGFGWLFIGVPDGFSSGVIKRDLKKMLGRIKEAPTQTTLDIANLPQWLLQTKPSKAIWIDLTRLESGDDIEDWKKALIFVIGRLNEQRDGIRKKFVQPIVFAIAPWVKDLLRVHAPDLWSNRTLSTELTPTPSQDFLPYYEPTSELITQRNQNFSSLDPLFALEEAEKIKNIPEQQENYKKFLRRAIAGFIGQSQESNNNGKWEVALALAQKAVALARVQPNEFESDLANSLNNLGVRYNVLGELEKALETKLEAVKLYRELARESPDIFNPHLASSLNNLGNSYDMLGEREKALKTKLEAVKLYRGLAQEKSDAFNPNLAGSLSNLGNGYYALGEREKAFEATLEAIKIRRELAREKPSAFKPDLASSLNNLGAMYDTLGEREKALEVTLESIKLRRELARERPDAFNPNLAGSLNNLGGIYDALGEREKALEVTLEGTRLFEDLFAKNRLAFNEGYAMSLNLLSSRYYALDQLEPAHKNAYLAVQVLSQLFLRYPQALADRMIHMLRDYATLCQTLNLEPDQALLEPIVPILEPFLPPDNS